MQYNKKDLQNVGSFMGTSAATTMFASDKTGEIRDRYLEHTAPGTDVSKKIDIKGRKIQAYKAMFEDPDQKTNALAAWREGSDRDLMTEAGYELPVDKKISKAGMSNIASNYNLGEGLSGSSGAGLDFGTKVSGIEGTSGYQDTTKVLEKGYALQDTRTQGIIADALKNKTYTLSDSEQAEKYGVSLSQLNQAKDRYGENWQETLGSMVQDPNVNVSSYLDSSGAGFQGTSGAGDLWTDFKEGGLSGVLGFDKIKARDASVESTKLDKYNPDHVYYDRDNQMQFDPETGTQFYFDPETGYKRFSLYDSQIQNNARISTEQRNKMEKFGIFDDDLEYKYPGG